MLSHAQKYIPFFIILIIGFILVTSLNLGEYRNHHSIGDTTVSGEVFLSDVALKKGPLPESWIVDMIDKSQERVWVAVYTFTLPSLREALFRAQKRGVDVRVLMEKNPFGNTGINRETKTFLEKNFIPLHESGEKQFAFMHAKYMVFDSMWVVETANWTRASFASNREFFMVGSESGILQNLTHIFIEDFGGKIGQSRDMRMLVGPTNARERMIAFLEKTKTSIDIYAPSFSDSGLLTKLTQLCHQKKIIRILLADYDISEKKSQDSACAQFRVMKKPLHAKGIIRDKKDAFVGSFNFTQNSLENNREIGLFITGKSVKSISQSFESDWKQSEVALR